MTDKLKELALAAKNGVPWFPESHLASLLGRKDDAAYIAAASPDVVLALIAEVERLTKKTEADAIYLKLARERTQWYEELRQATDGPSESMTHEDAVKEVNWLRAEVERLTLNDHKFVVAHDELLARVNAMEDVAVKLKLAGASLPAPEIKGTIESAMVSGLCVALAIVENALASGAAPKEPALYRLMHKEGAAWIPASEWMTEADASWVKLAQDKPDEWCIKEPLDGKKVADAFRTAFAQATPKGEQA